MVLVRVAQRKIIWKAKFIFMKFVMKHILKSNQNKNLLKPFQSPHKQYLFLFHQLSYFLPSTNFIKNTPYITRRIETRYLFFTLTRDSWLLQLYVDSKNEMKLGVEFFKCHTESYIIFFFRMRFIVSSFQHFTTSQLKCWCKSFLFYLKMVAFVLNCNEYVGMEKNMRHC